MWLCHQYTAANPRQTHAYATSTPSSTTRKTHDTRFCLRHGGGCGCCSSPAFEARSHLPVAAFPERGAPERSWLYLSMRAAEALTPTLWLFAAGAGGAACYGCAEAALPSFYQRAGGGGLAARVAARCFLIVTVSKLSSHLCCGSRCSCWPSDTLLVLVRGQGNRWQAVWRRAKLECGYPGWSAGAAAAPSSFG